MSTISIVVPVYQNAPNLESTVPKLLGLKDTLKEKHELELVFVDDGSTDRSFEILKKFAKLFPKEIVLVRLSRNFGQSPAIQAGLTHSRGDCAAIISADLQDPYEEIPTMVRRWEEGAKYVLAYRQARSENRRHQFVSNLYWRMVARFGLPGFPETGYDFCLLDRQLISDISRIGEKNTSIFPLIYWLGYRPVCIPINRAERTAGKSQWNFMRKLRLTLDTLIGFTYVPVRAITYSALGTALCSFLYLSFVLVRWLIKGSPVQGWTSLILVMLLLGSITLFSLGIICEYLWRVLDEARKRPPFIVDCVIQPRPQQAVQKERRVRGKKQREGIHVQ